MRISRSTMAGLQSDINVHISELIPPRDYSKLNEQNCQLRLWIPLPVKISLEELCVVHDVSLTVYLTKYFATYLYGHHEMLRMRANSIGLYEPKPERRYNAQSIREPAEPNLGKNIYPLKIFMPNKIKSGLQAEADRVEVTLSEFSRALISAHLFGYEYGRDSWNIANNEVDAAREWENMLIDGESL